MIDPDRLGAAYRTARAALLAERTPAGYWVGELSASALSTATAVTALALVGRAEGQDADYRALIDAGLNWLENHQNADGGWGDTVKSVSNISTTMLCRAAFHIAGRWPDSSTSYRRCERWLTERYGASSTERAEAVRRRYGRDRTFAVPILMMSALAGLVPWREVGRLPFELACLPQSWYRLARMPVVSYGLPALIAIGQVIHHHRPTWNPIARGLRSVAKAKSLRILERIQPSSGGYLEATPLTSFVIMSLVAMKAESPAARRVVERGVEFLVASVRADGSWPIDTNLSIWLTTLSINALAAGDDLDVLDRRDELAAWLVEQQTKEVHPYTGAAAGAWGWSHLPGSVPDCDDTPGATLALVNLERNRRGNPIQWEWNWGMARNWIIDLQNRDGGWPTFCRGWGKLAFDRSGTDLTAHSLRAFWALGDNRQDYFGRLYGQATERGFRYLSRTQRSDGSWLPLWFGNQHSPDDINPVYGTSRVLAAYRDLGRSAEAEAMRGIAYLLGVQNPDGGWGGAKGCPTSVEETAVALEILIDMAPTESAAAVDRGMEYLVSCVEDGTFVEPTPIGFYFAKLWYFERLYPVIFTVAALGRAMRRIPPENS